MAKTMDGSVVVLTGASSGIGRATAFELARRGATVVLAARGEAALREVAARAVGRFGRIDVWVNNAGVYLLGTVEETPSEPYRQVLETNFFGAVHGARACCRSSAARAGAC